MRSRSSRRLASLVRSPFWWAGWGFTLSRASRLPRELFASRAGAGEDRQRFGSDWGQDLRRLSARVEELGIQTLAIGECSACQPFGVSEPSQTCRIDPLEPVSGWVAISEWCLRVWPRTPSGKTGAFAWLDGKSYERIGKSVRLERFHLVRMRGPQRPRPGHRAGESHRRIAFRRPSPAFDPFAFQPAPSSRPDRSSPRRLPWTAVLRSFKFVQLFRSALPEGLVELSRAPARTVHCGRSAGDGARSFEADAVGAGVRARALGEVHPAVRAPSRADDLGDLADLEVSPSVRLMLKTSPWTASRGASSTAGKAREMSSMWMSGRQGVPSLFRVDAAGRHGPRLRGC